MIDNGTPAIWRHGDDPAVGFAACELARCLRRMTARPVRVRRAVPGGGPQPGLAVGLPQDFGDEAVVAAYPSDRWIDTSYWRGIVALAAKGQNPLESNNDTDD